MEDADHDTPDGHGSVYRVAGTINIARAATTQREIDALPDPLTIDLSDINRMDTVGAWIVYRTVRDRGAKVIGASRDEVSLLKQVGEFDVPTRVVPDEPHNLTAMVQELGKWIADTGTTLIGLLGFFGATLIGLVLVCVLVVITVLAAAFYNLFSELIGGLEVTVVEHEDER